MYSNDKVKKDIAYLIRIRVYMPKEGNRHETDVFYGNNKK